MKKIILLLLTITPLCLVSCKDIMEESMYKKGRDIIINDKGVWDSSGWNNSKWQK